MCCPQCQAVNPTTLKVCGECGTQLSSPKDVEVTETMDAPIEELARDTTFAERYKILLVLLFFLLGFTNSAFTKDYAGRIIVLHGGGLPGYISQVVVVPEEKLGIVILENDSVPIHDAVANKILDSFLTNKDKDYVQHVLESLDKYKLTIEKQRQKRLGKQIPNTSHSKPLIEYTGLYKDKMYGNAEISLKGGKLILSLLPAKECFTSSMEHFHYDTFKIDFDFAFLEFGLLTFNLDSDGQIQGFVIDLPSNDLHFSNLRFIKQNTK